MKSKKSKCEGKFSHSLAFGGRCPRLWCILAMRPNGVGNREKNSMSVRETEGEIMKIDVTFVRQHRAYSLSCSVEMQRAAAPVPSRNKIINS